MVVAAVVVMTIFDPVDYIYPCAVFWLSSSDFFFNNSPLRLIDFCFQSGMTYFDRRLYRRLLKDRITLFAPNILPPAPLRCPRAAGTSFIPKRGEGGRERGMPAVIETTEEGRISRRWIRRAWPKHRAEWRSEWKPRSRLRGRWKFCKDTIRDFCPK